MFIIYIAFAYWAFLIASNIFKRFWTWLAVGVAIGALTTIIFENEFMTVFVVQIIVMALLTIGILIKLRIKKE